MSEDETERLLSGANGQRLRASIAHLSGWQPIETLETTDEPLPPVLLYNPRHAADPDFPGLALSTSNRVFASRHGKRHGYTHWQPLPEPPTA